LQDTCEEIGQYATAAEAKLVKQYREIRAKNLHKMEAVPVCRFDW